MSKQTLSTKIEQLQREISKLSEDELQLLEHSLTAIRQTRQQGLHFFGNLVGIELPDWNEPGKQVHEQEVKLHLGPHITNYFGVAQGGALYTFADIAIGSLIMSRLGPGKVVATIELKMNYLLPGTGNVLRCTPTILHWGKRTVVAECKIKNEQDQLVATAVGTFYRQ